MNDSGSVGGNSISRTVNHSFNHFINQTLNQSLNVSVYQSINESIIHFPGVIYAVSGPVGEQPSQGFTINEPIIYQFNHSINHSISFQA